MNYLSLEGECINDFELRHKVKNMSEEEFYDTYKSYRDTCDYFESINANHEFLSDYKRLLPFFAEHAEKIEA